MTSIVADIGGTNARFAIATSVDGTYKLDSVKVLDCRQFPDFKAALDHWLGSIGQPRPQRACIAAAGAMEKTPSGNSVYMTNLGWRFSAGEVREHFGLAHVELINDFAALAKSLPLLGKQDYWVLRDKPQSAEAPMAVLGPGTGLGVAGLIVEGGRHHVVAGEGGHANLSAGSERELQLLQILMHKQSPVFNEWVLSGSGLVNLYRAVAELHGREPEDLTPPDISARGLDNSDPLCRETLLDFLNFLGGVAGDAALYYGALGGVFLGGGILPRIRELLPESQFEQRFTDKGRMQQWMQRVPVYVLHAGLQALIGAAAQLGDHPVE